MIKQVYNVAKIDRSLPTQVNNLLITCVDYRIQKGINVFTNSCDTLGVGQYDRFSYPGGSLQFEINQQMMTSNIQLFRQIHGIKRIVCLDHADCGACQAYLRQTHPEYKDMPASEKPSFEKNVQLDLLHKAKDTILKYFPDMETDLVYYDERGVLEYILSPSFFAPQTGPPPGKKRHSREQHEEIPVQDQLLYVYWTYCNSVDQVRCLGHSGVVVCTSFGRDEVRYVHGRY